MKRPFITPSRPAFNNLFLDQALKAEALAIMGRARKLVPLGQQRKPGRPRRVQPQQPVVHRLTYELPEGITLQVDFRITGFEMFPVAGGMGQVRVQGEIIQSTETWHNSLRNTGYTYTAPTTNRKGKRK